MSQRSQAEGEDKEQVQTAETACTVSYDQTKENPESDQNVNKETKDMEERKGTRDLFLETLTQIGCQYEVGEGENGDITFAYQGEYFLVRTSNSIRFVHIYDTHWGHIELYDIEEISRLKKAINESNLDNSVTAVYTIDKTGGTVDVHCKSVILFIQEIPDISEYLRLELNEFFRVHEKINLEMARQREMETEK
jgi:hypothetical protein